MTFPDSPIPIIYGRIILASAGRNPVDTRRLLAGTGLTLDSLKQLDAGISTAGYCQLIRNAIALSGDDAILLEAGHKVPITAHGPLGHAAIFSPDLYAVFKLCEQFSRLRAHFMTLTMIDNGAETEMYFQLDDSLGNEKDAALDFVMAGMATSRAALHLVPLNPLRARLTRARPVSHARYREILACDIHYEQADNCLVFATADLRAPLPAHDPVEFAEAIRKCRQLLNQTQPPTSMREAVECVFERNPGLLCSIEKVAENFNMSARTLQRRLQAEGIGYQPMLDEWLRKMALRYLVQEKLSTAVTATMLGYTDEANFRRAFKRWFGVAPSVYTAQKDSNRAGQPIQETPL